MLNEKDYIKEVWKRYDDCKNTKSKSYVNHYKKSNNNHHILSMVAIFIFSIIITCGVAYGAITVYNKFMQKTGIPSYVENFESYFEVTDEEILYKKISNYEEYQAYKAKWNDIVEMSPEDFDDNFIIVVVGFWRMPGIKITNITAYETTLYVELDRTLTQEEIESENTMVSVKISRELDRENISVYRIKKEVTSEKYVKLEELPEEYSKEEAEKDNCVVTDNRYNNSCK